ncbi:hypothetical protein, partial [Flagellimonas lutimaris]|uniref:hypothetical protein n=1 Tax=Flagellimonas lutimaris TaxID=475082 RepID=UPI0039C0AB21
FSAAAPVAWENSTVTCPNPNPIPKRKKRTKKMYARPKVVCVRFEGFLNKVDITNTISFSWVKRNA